MKCDEGYVCEVCGRDVEAITESDLYLRYVLGEVLLERLHLQRERHIRCNPSLAQFIVDERFEPVTCDGPFAKSNLDADFVRGEEERVTAAWRHLQDIPTLGLHITEYPAEIAKRIAELDQGKATPIPWIQAKGMIFGDSNDPPEK